MGDVGRQVRIEGGGQHIGTLHSNAQKGAAAIGAGIGITMVLFVWVLGSVILGFMMMFTRGRRELITVERPVR